MNPPDDIAMVIPLFCEFDMLLPINEAPKKPIKNKLIPIVRKLLATIIR